MASPNTAISILGLFCLTAGCSGDAPSDVRLPPEATSQTPDFMPRHTIEVHAPGVRWPELMPAHSASLSGDELVIGLVVDGSPRAYVVSALTPEPDRMDGSFEAMREQLGNHVVNDMIGNTPVTVTHCDITECTRVLTDATAPSPLGIGIWGWKNGDMQLLINGQRIPHRSPQLPLEEIPHVVVPWEDWSYLYPDTDVYIGG